MLDRTLVDSLFPTDLPDPAFWEERYPPRQQPAEAKVTRLGPSPTGSLHLGGLYVATLNADIARRSGGAYLVRVEDTDQAREVEGAVEQFDRAFAYFGLQPDEHGETGSYGPYTQSQRAMIYQSYVRELLRRDQAYLCFATKDELAAITAQQQAQKVPTGYYGTWALWRNASAEEVRAKLDAGVPYVVRFRTPAEAANQRVHFVDAIRGRLEHEASRNDAVLLKSSDQDPRLPTYHLAHVVDDHLMRVNLVIRGEEWISSVPLHLQLFAALGFEPIEYAHVAPLMKQDGGSKRKLSKRKDPEASVDYYIETGFPAEAVLHYIRGLLNGRLADTPFTEALDAPLRLSECGVAGPLVDMVKLMDISADYVATLSGAEVFDAVRTWAGEYDAELATVLAKERDLALRAISVERDGVDNPRKDLRVWSDFRTAYGFFFDDLFQPVTDPSDERFGGLDPAVVRALAADFVAGYQLVDDPQEWFGQIRELAAKHGFAKNPKEYKKNPDAYPGSIREAAQVFRVAITGSTRSPDLHAVASALGTPEVLRRVGSLR
ncbi:glutamate--tRNA ligase [Fodinicola acaciae]|uniref:glutamate--tRNA ligase n=1 Tax=Fodinicola acaciae TaxID=2681555 RepID=UPI0013D0C92F|nr:glutamate--tRNA ligase family protein [Fodinicola acaciae]